VSSCSNCRKLRIKVNELRVTVDHLTRVTLDQEYQLRMYKSLEVFVEAVVERAVAKVHDECQYD